MGGHGDANYTRSAREEYMALLQQRKELAARVKAAKEAARAEKAVAVPGKSTAAVRILVKYFLDTGKADDLLIHVKGGMTKDDFEAFRAWRATKKEAAKAKRKQKEDAARGAEAVATAKS
jgi:hypothetical protein